MRKALYRKYRPKSLSDVIGQEHITSILLNSLNKHQFSHAYLFTGPRGTGKTSIARILAHEINNFDYELEDSYIDIVEIDAASNTSVDNIRDLREKATIAPVKGQYKIYIIDEIHMLSKSAFNALLKILEEPPEHIIFIMATTDIEKVPITIISRAQVFNFKLADTDTMQKYLRHVSDAENINIEDSALNIIAHRGGGSFRDSLSLLDQISTISDAKITADIVNSSLGIPAEESINQLLSYYPSGDFDSITNTLKNLLATGLKPESIAESIIKKITNNPKPELLTLLKKLPSVSSPFAEAKLLLAVLPEYTTPVATQVSCPTQPATTIQPTQPTQTIPTPATKPTQPKTPIAAPPAKQTPPTPSIDSADFSWDNFLAAVKADSGLLCSQFNKTTHKVTDKTLEIFPEKKSTKDMLERKNSIETIRKYIGDRELIIHDPEDSQKDSALSKISDIMGGIQEVKTNGGEIPF